MGIDEDTTQDHHFDFELPDSDVIEAIAAEVTVGQKQGRAHSAVVKEPQLKIAKTT